MPVDEFGREIKGARQQQTPLRSPSPTTTKSESYGGGGSSGVGGGSGGVSRSRRSESPPRRRPRPIERYVQEPMLCQYVWKDQIAAAMEKEEVAAENAAEEKEVVTASEVAAEVSSDADPALDDIKKDDVDDDDDDKPSTKSSAMVLEDNDDDASSDTKKDATTAKITTNTKETYDEYRKNYCLNYVRAFFNEHMDDSWFRNRYSPLGAKRVAVQNLGRAAKEAQHMQRDMQDGEGTSLLNFVAASRLGHGVKERNNNSSSSGNKRRYGESEPSSSSSNDLNIVPTSHVVDIVNRHLKLMDVPPHVTEEQLRLALLDHAIHPSKTTVEVFSGSIRAQDANQPLYRDAYCVFATTEIKAQILANIQKASVLDSTDGGGGGGGHVPRKQDDRKVLELDIECSDPYGRLEIEDEAIGGNVPHRKASVFLATSTETQKVVVLSASLSSAKRIQKDREAAILMARALDVKHKIPQDCRLDDLLVPMLQPTEDYTNEDVLDVAIAYLRRVHLFSFYNGCVFEDNLANVLGGHHATSTIHLRLKDADEILHKAKEDRYGSTAAAEMEKDEEDDGNSNTTDLLVKILDESIRKASEATKEWVTNDCFVNPTVDAEASEIEEQEKQTFLGWVDQHGSIDEDGRARCSFHFCRKLFKDMTFLEKHLKKKHNEFAKAEVAKCHDTYMMKAWDSEEVRPVPAILVDCGSNFGLVPSAVLGAATPMAADPETELWEKEEERRKRLEEQEAQRESHRHGHHHRHRHNSEGGDGDSMSAPPQPPRRSNFVDVDDMKEEKVELSFENLEVPVQPPKKKKKKKKLL